VSYFSIDVVFTILTIPAMLNVTRIAGTSPSVENDLQKLA